MPSIGGGIGSNISSWLNPRTASPGAWAYNPFGGHATLGDSIIGYWKHDETSADGDRIDEVAANNLRPTAANMTYAAGISGNAYSNDGNARALTTLSQIALTGSSTHSLWVYFTGGTSRSMFGHGSGVSTSAAFAELGVDVFYAYAGNGSTFVSATQTYENTSAWVHFVITFDTADNKIRTYCNTVAGTPSSALTGTRITSAQTVTFGRRDGGSYMIGRLDEFAIWGRVLTVPEITDLYNGGTGLFY